MKLKLIILTFFVANTFVAFSQVNSNISINYPKNVDAPLTKVEKQQIDEVYASQAVNLIYNNEDELKAFKHLLRNRIEIYEELDASKQKKCKLLSEIPLNKQYNSSLKRHKSFDLKTFNPLKYKLAFFGKGTYLYRIDNTNYFILVKSKHRRF